MPDRQELLQAGVDLAVFRSATVPLARRGPGKWHVIGHGRDRWGSCTHARAFDAADAVAVPFLGLPDDVCAKCAPEAALPGPVRDLWAACRTITDADRRARTLAGSTGPRTWPGYARALAEAAHHGDEQVRDLLKPLLDDGEVGQQAWSALRAWTAVVERSHLALAAYQADAPPADTSAAVSRACDTVAEDPDVRATDQALDTAVGENRPPTGLPRYGHLSLWRLVRTAWALAKRQGRSAEDAVASTLETAASRWADLRVKDVTALPDLPGIPSAPYPTPSAWADAILQRWWRDTATAWCARLEAAIAHGPVASGRRVLLLVRDWPLTRPGDEDLAYLAQFPQVGAAVPDSAPDEYYRSGRRQAVVLSVPGYAAEQALAHSGHQPDRITHGAPEPDGSATDGGANPRALDLLRTVYPYLPEDDHADGAPPGPSAAVREARAAERAARGAARPPGAHANGSTTATRWYDAFRDGRWTWVPDSDGEGTAGQQLAALLERHHSATVMRLHAQCGPAGLRSLFGFLDTWDARRGILRLRPVDGSRALPVAQHRIIGVVGDPHRRGAGRAPLWEDYGGPNGVSTIRAW
ncbi:hypothetical protein PUR61_17015 [Streptomyces sp. BE20]|uniref:hypothetical protein n=1 Tax=Streptomyces sp. BE20 TaxID=3002525 RepID=UPI002E760425|nr:hypothetical protein [Streptomyces sp. BE20]MEE1823879.1 hypothetical protein [Streptomyces sp. BE20]